MQERDLKPFLGTEGRPKKKELAKAYDEAVADNPEVGGAVASAGVDAVPTAEDITPSGAEDAKPAPPPKRKATDTDGDATPASACVVAAALRGPAGGQEGSPRGLARSGWRVLHYSKRPKSEADGAASSAKRRRPSDDSDEEAAKAKKEKKEKDKTAKKDAAEKKEKAKEEKEKKHKEKKEHKEKEAKKDADSSGDEGDEPELFEPMTDEQYKARAQRAKTPPPGRAGTWSELTSSPRWPRALLLRGGQELKKKFKEDRDKLSKQETRWLRHEFNRRRKLEHPIDYMNSLKSKLEVLFINGVDLSRSDGRKARRILHQIETFPITADVLKVRQWQPDQESPSLLLTQAETEHGVSAGARRAGDAGGQDDQAPPQDPGSQRYLPPCASVRENPGAVAPYVRTCWT